MKWLWPVLRPQYGRIVLGSAAAAVQTAVGLATPYLFKIAIDRAVVPDHLAVLNPLALVFLALTALNLLAVRVETLTVGRVGQHTLHAVRCRLFAHLQRLPLAFYQRERSGGVVARMVGDIESLTGLVSGGLMQLANNTATILGVAAILTVLDWRLALETLTITPGLAIAAVWYQKRSSHAWRSVREATSVATATLHETISGALEIQGYRGERARLAGVAAANHEVRLASRRAIALAAAFFPFVEFLSGVAFCVVLGFGGPRVLSGQLGIGTLTAFLLYLGLLFGPVFGLSEFYDTVQAAVAGGTRIGAVLAIAPTVAEPTDPVSLGHPRGEVRLSKVSFAYPGPDGTPGPDVLHDLDLVIPAGQTLALVGETGAGKSTIAGLLLRFHDPTAGSVTLDGIGLRKLRLAELRRAVSFVPQEGFLFSGSVEDNIRLGCPEASRAQIEAAVATLGFGPLVDRLPDGLDTDVGERGKRLASGERQVIALVRAWMVDPAVLVLDEATSHLDAEAEGRVSQALRRLRAGRTTVLIAHRLSTVADADRVAVVADGTIAETGSPAELVAAGGRFAQMRARWAAAAGSYQPFQIGQEDTA
ncbi:MAG TPA: ABC transporter ATP-binding protein [Streptosporangiaceae bacterium]|nr:ABC transporter ATP-binding protein [Streptosporangiaceae bacterium]